MSWNIDLVGKPADVQAAVAKETNVPQVLKDAVNAFASNAANSPKPPGAIRVASMGHFGTNDGWSNVHSFSIQPLTLVGPPS